MVTVPAVPLAPAVKLVLDVKATVPVASGNVIVRLSVNAVFVSVNVLSAAPAVAWILTLPRTASLSIVYDELFVPVHDMLFTFAIVSPVVAIVRIAVPLVSSKTRLPLDHLLLTFVVGIIFLLFVHAGGYPPAFGVVPRF